MSVIEPRLVEFPFITHAERVRAKSRPAALSVSIGSDDDFMMLDERRSVTALWHPQDYIGPAMDEGSQVGASFARDLQESCDRAERDLPRQLGAAADSLSDRDDLRVKGRWSFTVSPAIAGGLSVGRADSFGSVEEAQEALSEWAMANLKSHVLIVSDRVSFYARGGEMEELKAGLQELGAKREAVAIQESLAPKKRRSGAKARLRAPRL